MNEDVFDNPVEFRTAVASPHFDDRRVVQRAQPVVPLDEIRATLRNRKLLFLSAAFTIAMMLGAASALLAVHIKQRSAASGVTQVTIDTTPETSSPEPETAVAIPLESTIEEPVVEEPPPVVKPEVTVKKQQQPVLAQRPRVINREAFRPRPGEVEPTENEQLEQIREAVLYDQWQERRMRRAARRERRNRDLTRVDELFEGTRRPDRP
jgi:hypothetical protein